MALWASLDGQQAIGPLTLELVRVVESQEEIATLSLVDSMAEQDILESLLEDSKPGQLPGNLHYLLASPFRYPPLQWGSRFGRTHEPSLFYGSLNIETALTECAFYRFVFLSGVTAPFPKAVVSQHTSFRVRGHGERGVNLTLPPFAEHTDALRSPEDYRAAQALGSDMREAGVQVVIYLSARDRRASALNGAVFDPQVFAKSQPQRFQAWTCHATTEAVRFIAAPGATPGREIFAFTREDFLVDGRLPMPPA
ncbi:RES family NAD+ phosphorylase [Simiduia sp. 21SJ11W-1]|uniref:RES family NAD+ phosphorylase n=1 Tax=Simiduia sp. 21SJ11W-1 TaxID=2909669 RepID=UPI0020A0A53D|nr:RES family NAD+ phosphorylase [Simiduia sp. 21SJ11W-1]UTA49059.1 RES family NAD+ phosphorylase [Simiduia sp. 21SJ11W-1]